MDNCKKIHLVNCDEGQRMGCASFCCRKLVRLEPDEMKPTNDRTPPKGFVDKDSEGYCIHFRSQQWPLHQLEQTAKSMSQI